MSNKTNFVSLIQLSTYSGLKSFLTQYHEEVKNEFGQFLGINKALIAASKVIGNFKNHHEMSDQLKSIEANKKLFEVRKGIITVTHSEKIDDYQSDFSTTIYNSWEDAKTFIFNEFYKTCVNEDKSIEDINEHFTNYYDDEDIEDFDDVLDYLNHLEQNESIDIYELSGAIEELTNNGKEYSISESFLTLDVTCSDIDTAINDNKFS